MSITFVLIVYKIHLEACQCLILYLLAINSDFPPDVGRVRAPSPPPIYVHVNTASWFWLVPNKILLKNMLT